MKPAADSGRERAINRPKRSALARALRGRRQDLLLGLALAVLILVACQGAADEVQPVTPEAREAPASALPSGSEPTAAIDEATPEPEATGPEAATSAPDDGSGVTEPAAAEPAAAETAAAETAALETTEPAVESTAAESPATSVSLALVAGGFARPVYLTHAGDDRLFVVEQEGRIRLLVDGQLLPDPFLDISDRVGANALEQGLLSVAFHPNYAQNGRFFVDYTDQQGDTIIAGYQVSSADPDKADPDSEQLLLTVDQPYGNHNGGQLQFGPDGYLYVSLGDGGSAADPGNNGQNPNTLLGALLRLDVDADPGAYAIPDDNPFVGDPNGRDEIWAYGLRNPWRFSFDRQLGDLYIADVGQNLWEEVNFQAAGEPGGANYGWNVLEATHCFGANSCDSSGAIPPVAEYEHRDGNCSISGGYVYRGQRYPELTGNYFFADYCSGVIWSLLRQPDGDWLQLPLQRAGIVVSSFGEDNQGELYVLDHVQGDVYQLGP